MKIKSIAIIVVTILLPLNSFSKQKSTFKEKKFDVNKDLLLVQFDSKTDVDDLHTAAALATLLSNSKFSKINYYAVAGTYGIQDGLYVPPNDLFKLAFGTNWSDANENFKEAINRVKFIAEKTLTNSGDVWIAEAGQSDFTAALIKAILTDMTNLNTTKRIHVVQHSDWNEKTTTVNDLKFVKEKTDYQKISDGNVAGNGTPGFLSLEKFDLNKTFKNPELINIWKLAMDLGNEYNGKEGRYLNHAISEGGVDFSDFSEVCWILGLQDIKDSDAFFSLYSN